jgi:hypothetical protein
VAGDEAAVPADQRCRLHDQEHLGQAWSIERTGERGEDGAVRVGKPGPFDLALQDQHLVAQGEDLGVAFIAGREQLSETVESEPGEGSERDHAGGTVQRLPEPGYVLGRPHR